ncbi:DUF3820 family protein [Mesonia sp. K7]|uniref:DUF3820 family protein n=1 Tax=Mesonia sp. K7 TaxID=2218606 RepID=UPI000DA9F443|nr:DUF3820 family protein [Mesonia sp. K7]PZD79436.1 hypothetical protein DNG35_00010 [Mesonia sp. K7]
MLPNSQYLLKLAYTKMPFGKYKDWYLSDIPEAYYVWFQQKGFPQNNLGKQMQEIYELKLNGLEFLLKELRNKYPKP